MKEQLPLDDFEREVRYNADNFTMIPSDGLFERISAEINPEIKKRKPFIYITFIPAIAAVFLIGAGLTFLLPKSDISRDAPVSVSSSTTEENPAANLAVETHAENNTSANSQPEDIASVKDANAVSGQLQNSPASSPVANRKGNRSPSRDRFVNRSEQPGIVKGKEATVEDIQAPEPGSGVDKQIVKTEEPVTPLESIIPDSTLVSIPPVLPEDKLKTGVASDNSKKESVSRIPTSKFVVDAFFTPEKYQSKYTQKGITTLFVSPDTIVQSFGNAPSTPSQPDTKSVMGYSAGVKMEYRFHRHLGVSTGIVYSNRREIFRPQAAVAVFGSVQGGLNKTVNDSGYVYHNTFRSLELPVLLNFHYSARRFSYNITSGISYSRLIGLHYYYQNSSVTEPLDFESLNSHTSPYSKNNVVFSISADLGYRIGNRMEIHAGPSYRQAARSVLHANNLTSQKPYSYGVSAGVRYFL